MRRARPRGGGGAAGGKTDAGAAQSPAGVFQAASDAAMVAGGITGAAAVAKTWLTQRGETRREELRQDGMTARARLTQPDNADTSGDPDTRGASRRGDDAGGDSGADDTGEDGVDGGGPRS